MNDHPQTRVIVYDQVNGRTRDFYCDSMLEKILFKLNEIGATTIFSCQDLNGEGIIQFGFDHSVPKDIMRHAVTMISAAYPDQYLIFDINAYFDPIILVVKQLHLYEQHVPVFAFDRETGTYEECEALHLTLNNPQVTRRNHDNPKRVSVKSASEA